MLFILIALVLTFTFFHIVYGNKLSKKAVVISTAILIFIAGFRYFVGVDYDAYKTMYEASLSTGNYTYNIEPIWRVFHLSLHAINGTYVLWFLLVSALTVLGVILGIRRMSPYFFLSLVFFTGSTIYVETFNIVRQFLAISIVFASTPFLFQNKQKWFVCSVIIAMTCHYSAVIALSLLLFRRKVKPVVLIIALVLTAWFGNYILTIYIIPFTEDLGHGISSALNLRRDYSFNINVHIDAIGINSGLKKYTLNVITIIVVWLTKRWNNRNIFYLNCFVCSTIIYNIFCSFMELARLQEYFYIYGIILFPLLVEQIKDKRFKLLCFFLLTISIYVFTFKSFLNIDYRMKFELFDI